MIKAVIIPSTCSTIDLSSGRGLKHPWGWESWRPYRFVVFRQCVTFVALESPTLWQGASVRFEMSAGFVFISQRPEKDFWKYRPILILRRDEF